MSVSRQAVPVYSESGRTTVQSHCQCCSVVQYLALGTVQQQSSPGSHLSLSLSLSDHLHQHLADLSGELYLHSAQLHQHQAQRVPVIVALPVTIE